MLTYDHGGAVLWGTEHFKKYLESAVQWLDRYASFKIGLDNDAYTCDYIAEPEPSPTFARLGLFMLERALNIGQYGI
jgi:hypothetical protein